MGVRYECDLPSDVLKKAVAELNEPQDNDARLAEIDKLRNRFEEEQDDLELIRTDDMFFLRFLRAKKFKHEKAYNMLVNYHKQRRDFREVFDKVDNPEALTEYMMNGAVVPIKQKASDGSAVVIGQPGKGMPDTALMSDFLAMIILVTENLLKDETITVYGMTVIVDYSNFNLNLLKQFTPSFGKKFGGVMADAMPARLKSMNVVNEYKIFTIIYNIMKPFTREKMQKRLELHGSNFTNLHKKVDPTGLPPFLAGTGPDLDLAGWKNRLLKSVGEGEDTAL
ncbi:alpha-tocopherol transfer protein-like [Styela clava]